MKITSFKYFYPEAPRLLHIDQPLFQKLSDDPMWVAEPKYNEQRLQLHVFPGTFHLLGLIAAKHENRSPKKNGIVFEFWDRHGNLLSYVPSEEILTVLHRVVPSMNTYCLFDGGLRHNKVPGIKHKIMLYDVFIWQGDLLIGKPFWYRRNILKKIAKCEGDPLGIPPQYRTDFRRAFEDLIQDPEIEGLVIKNTRGLLELGRTSAVNSKWMWKVRKESGRYRF